MSKIGIDAVELSLTVKALEWRLLECNDRVDLHHGRNDLKVIWNSVSRDQPSCNCIDRIIIKDSEKFYRCTIGIICPTDSRPILYCKLHLTVHHARGNNFFNMTWSEYNLYIRTVADYLTERYGVEIDVEQATVSYIELNCNISLTQEYRSYSRVLKLLMSSLNKKFKALQYYEREGAVPIYDSLLRANNSISVLMYNKTYELGQGHTRSDDEKVLRIEFALKTPNKIRRVFNTRKWNALTDTAICECYHKLFESLIVCSFKRWKNLSQKMLVQELRQLQGKNGWPRKWAQLFMNRIRDKDLQSSKPLILDIEQVYDAMRCLPDPSRNISKKILLLQRNEQAICDSTYLHKDLLKVDELFQKELCAYKNFSSE